MPVSFRPLELAVVATAILLSAPLASAQPQNRREHARPLRLSRGVLNEGAFLADLPGRLLTLDNGVSAFVFDRSAQGRAVPPMAMLPCATLMRMEQIRDARKGVARFRVSGQVFLYQGRNYLLPTFYKALGSVDDAAQAPAEESARGDATPDPSAIADPSVEDLVGAIERFSPPPRDKGAEPAPLRTGNLMPDGAFLKPRRGHITRAPAGGLAFTIDNDADTSAGPTAPLVILPGGSLALIERLLKEHGEGVALILSGRVFLYAGRNYLLPSMVQAQLDGSAGLRSVQ